MDAPTYVVNVDGAVERDGEYLFIERAANEDHASGLLAFPGGKLEAPPGSDDAIAATARRELAEEVGVEVGAVEFVTSRTFEADDGALCLNVVTLCEYQGERLTFGNPRKSTRCTGSRRRTFVGIRTRRRIWWSIWSLSRKLHKNSRGFFSKESPRR